MLNFSSLSPTNIPSIVRLCLIFIANVSTVIRKRYGDREQPCLTPLIGLNHDEMLPLLRQVNLMLLYKVFIILIKLLPKLRVCSVSNIDVYLIVSKALRKSMFSMIPGLL